MSRVVAVKVVVALAYPRLTTATPIQVGAGAGVPAADGGSVWVPRTGTGELERVDPASGAIASKTHVGVSSPAGGGFLDSALATGGSIWAASDSGGTIARVDPASGAQTASIQASVRPEGWLPAKGRSGPSASRAPT